MSQKHHNFETSTYVRMCQHGWTIKVDSFCNVYTVQFTSVLKLTGRADVLRLKDSKSGELWPR